jgi:hypothetical protein
VSYRKTVRDGVESKKLFNCSLENAYHAPERESKFLLPIKKREGREGGNQGLFFSFCFVVVVDVVGFVSKGWAETHSRWRGLQ